MGRPLRPALALSAAGGGMRRTPSRSFRSLWASRGTLPTASAAPAAGSRPAGRTERALPLPVTVLFQESMRMRMSTLFTKTCSNPGSMLCHAPRSYRLTSGMRSSANHCAFSAGHVARGRGRVSGSSAALHTGATPILNLFAPLSLRAYWYQTPLAAQVRRARGSVGSQIGS